MQSNNLKVFFALVRAGLWEKDAQLSQNGIIDFNEVYRLAEEQSVVGLVAAGIEHVVDVKIPQAVALSFVGASLQLEQRNISMNLFVADLIDRMRKEDIHALIVKGQGIAQCYERPLWRACGDVDLLLNDDNYSKAKQYLYTIANSFEKESGKHLGFMLDSWVVELHGWLRCGLSKKMDKIIDEVQESVFCNKEVRRWMNGNTQIFLPEVNDDVIFIFSHFIKHFYRGGLGLRQICDWCRLLWTYRDDIDCAKLEKRLRKMGLMTEWKVFASYVVEYLGMPDKAMPLYDNNSKMKRKAGRINRFIIKVGNFGHNRDAKKEYPFVVRKVKSFGLRVSDAIQHAFIFPIDSFCFLLKITFNGIWAATKGIG